MRLHLAVPAVIALFALAGCAAEPGSSGADAATAGQIEALRGSRTLQRREHAICVAEFQNDPLRSNLAALIDRPAPDAPRVACDRIMRAVLDGRLSAADLNGMKAGRMDAKVVRVLQDR